VILDAIPEGEMNTARRLEQELNDLEYGPAEGLMTQRLQIKTPIDLQEALQAVLRSAKEDGLIPWIHLEGHGLDDESGFVTSSGYPISWETLKNLLIPINVETKLNVMLICATCYGASFVSAMGITDRAPLLGLIGPTRELTAGEVELDFTAFYRSFFENRELGEALDSLMARSSETDLYYGTTARQYFLQVWRGYKDKFCTERAIDSRARKLRKRLKRQHGFFLASVGRIKRDLRSKEPELFEKYSSNYFMHDVAPENSGRFPITYSEANRAAVA